MSPEVEEERLVVVPLRDLLDGMVCVQEALHLLGQVEELFEDELDLLRRQRAPDLRELERDQRQERDLSGERLRRRDADLEAGARIEDSVDLTCDLRAELVGDRERSRALLAREPHCSDRVGRLAGLRDPDHERVLRQHGVAVTPLARDVRLDGNARPLLDDVAPDDAGVVRGAACDDHDPAQVLDLQLVEPDPFQDELPASRAVADRLAHRFRLLVDLLEHERLVAALDGALVVPVDRLDLLVLDLAFIREEARAFGRDRDDLAVLDQLHPARLLEERGNRGCQEHLAFPDADDERALMARADEEIGMVVMDNDEGEVPFELAIDGAHGLQEIAFVVVLDQVHDHLRIRLGAEAMALGFERFLQLAIVLDDSVQHDCEPAVVTTRQRVRILLVDGAVRRPARVAETVIRSGAVRAGGVLQKLEIANRAHVLEPAVLAQRDARRVVAAVLESLETVEQQLFRRLGYRRTR